MAINYTKMAATTLRLITENGATWTIKREVKGTYNPATNAQTVSSTTSYTVTGLLKEYNDRLMGGENIRKGDKRLLIAATDIAVEPTTHDQANDGTYDWKIVSIKKTKPGDTNLLYELQVRQ